MISRVLTNKFCKSLITRTVCDRAVSRRFAETSSYENIKVNHWSQLNTYHYTELFNAIVFSSNSERMSEVVHTAAPIMTDQLLALALKIMAENEFQTGDAFNSKMLPFVKIYTKLFDRNNTQAFAETMVSMGKLEVRDEEYWQICRKKLVEEGYNRYIPLRNMGHLIKSLANVGQADPELLRILGSQVIKHRHELDDANINAAIAGFEVTGLGVDVFRKALEDGSQDGSSMPPRELH